MIEILIAKNVEKNKERGEENKDKLLTREKSVDKQNALFYERGRIVFAGTPDKSAL